eukprot:gene37742-49432_t
MPELVNIKVGSLRGTKGDIAARVINEIRQRLKFLNDVGLNYLSLDRSADTLSGGEAQRIRLASQIGSGLTGVMYVLDEPSIGLHQRDNERLIGTLKHLRDLGNSVLVVEHDEEAILTADHVIDMGPAAARLARAVESGERVAIFGDYDVDGACSAALLADFLTQAGARPRIHIPDRLIEGYGPNSDAIRQFAAEGASLLVTVDCGTTSHEPLAEARRVGLDLIVIDHHMAEIALPEAVAVVDPNRIDDASPHKHLAAVGVAFLLAVGVNRALRDANWYGTSRPEPDLRQWLDLVALGTVCDVVPLLGVNRALVKAGLQVMAQRRNVGLSALADVARLKETPEAYHLGFLLGPRVNAGGRVGQADLGARLLSGDDPHEVGAL